MAHYSPIFDGRNGGVHLAILSRACSCYIVNLVVTEGSTIHRYDAPVGQVQACDNYPYEIVAISLIGEYHLAAFFAPRRCLEAASHIVTHIEPCQCDLYKHSWIS